MDNLGCYGIILQRYLWIVRIKVVINVPVKWHLVQGCLVLHVKYVSDKGISSFAIFAGCFAQGDDARDIPMHLLLTIFGNTSLGDITISTRGGWVST